MALPIISTIERCSSAWRYENENGTQMTQITQMVADLISGNHKYQRHSAFYLLNLK